MKKRSTIIALFTVLWAAAVHGQSKFTPTNPGEEMQAADCQRALPTRDKHLISLIQVFSPTIEKTDAPNTDTFVEDCATVSISNSSDYEVRQILLLEEDGVTVCRDVLFFSAAGAAVICGYDPIYATGNVNYVPPAERREEEQNCTQSLIRPNDTVAALVEYEANPEGAFPGFFAVETLLPDDGDPHNQEECMSVFQPEDEANETRTVIFIRESQTCHDVLYYENKGANPVVCLYIIPGNTIRTHVVPINPAVIVLFFTSLSVIASAVLLVTHLIFPSLRTLPSKVIMNLSTAFLFGDIFYIVQTSLLLDDPSQSDAIDPIALVAYFFFYARFLWMALAGFEMCRTIHVGTQLRFNSAGKRLKIFLVYLLIGWSFPLIPTIVMAIVHFEKLEEGAKVTLFGFGGLVIVLVPVGIIMIFNVGTLIYLTYVLYKAHQWQIKVTDAIQSHKRKTNFTRIFIIILSLLGVTWILLFLIYIDDIQQNDAVLIITSIFNTLQPIFVTIAFIGTSKIVRKYMNLCRRRTDEDTMDTSTTVHSRFSKRKLMSFLFTDKELADKVSKHPSKYRFGHSNRSEISTTSMSILTRDSSNSLGSPRPASNGISPPKDSLAPITEEHEELEEETVVDDSPNHVAVDLKDTTV